MTVITVVAIAAIAALFVAFILPKIRNNLGKQVDNMGYTKQSCLENGGTWHDDASMAAGGYCNNIR